METVDTMIAAFDEQLSDDLAKKADAQATSQHVWDEGYYLAQYEKHTTFKSEKEAKGAEDQGLEWVGDNTGASRAQGEMLIVVADRKKVDPHGKVISQVITLPAK